MPILRRTDHMLVVCEICDRGFRFPIRNDGLAVLCDPSPLEAGWKQIPVPLNPEPGCPRPPLEAALACPACVGKRTLTKPEKFSIPYTPVNNACRERKD